MFDIHNIVAVDKIGMIGGSTYPSLMTLSNSSGSIVGQYVVKVFSQNHINQTQPTVKELISNILASKFDLNVPDPVLVRVNQHTIEELKRSGKFDGKVLLPGLYFGCKYIENALDYSPLLKDTSFDYWSIETIFAFDVLIRNVDRRKGKPNIFLSEDQIYLIDHELSFGLFNKSFLDFYENEGWEFITNHDSRYLFIDRLRRINTKDPLTFETFFYYLSTLNLNFIGNIIDVFKQYEVEILNIKDYLYYVKTNPELFKKLLFQVLNGRHF